MPASDLKKSCFLKTNFEEGQRTKYLYFTFIAISTVSSLSLKERFVDLRCFVTDQGSLTGLALLII